MKTAFVTILLLILVLDVYVVWRMWHILPQLWMKILQRQFIFDSAAGSVAVFDILALLMIVGSTNYKKKTPVILELVTSKPLEKPVKLVMASDLHLGYTNQRKELARWVDMINAENPDSVYEARNTVWEHNQNLWF